MDTSTASGSCTTTSLSLSMKLFRIQLPVEVCERVIDFCAEKSNVERAPHILCACSLTCRAWVPRSQYHLFRFIKLKSDQSLSHFVYSLRSSPRGAGYVRYLQVGAPTYPEEPYAHCWPGLLPLRFSSILSSLENLRGLHLLNYPLHPHSTSKLLSTFKTITQLGLHGCAFESFRDFARLVQTFPNIQELQIRTVTCGKNGFHMGSLRTPLWKRSRLQTLRVYCKLISKEFLTDVVSWLSTTPTTTSLRHLIFTGTNPRWISDNQQSFQLLLEQATSLETLELIYGHLSIFSPQVTKIDLHTSVELRRVVVTDIQPAGVAFLASMLSSVSSDHLREVTIGLKCRDFRPLRKGRADLDSGDWRALDDALGLPNLRQVEKVGLAVQSTLSSHQEEDVFDVQGELRKRLPNVHARGVLRQLDIEVHMDWLGERQKYYIEV